MRVTAVDVRQLEDAIEGTLPTAGGAFESANASPEEVARILADPCLRAKRLDGERPQWHVDRHLGLVLLVQVELPIRREAALFKAGRIADTQAAVAEHGNEGGHPRGVIATVRAT